MNIEDLKILCEAATPGPWCRRVEKKSDSFQLGMGDSGPHPVLYGNHQAFINWREQDLDFIVASRNILPLLIAVAEAAKAFMAEGKSYDDTEKCHVDMESALKALEDAT